MPAGETWTLERADPGDSGRAGDDQPVERHPPLRRRRAPGDAGLLTGTTVGGFPNPTIPLGSVPTLNPGTYWLAVAIMDDGPGLADAHRWFWSENDDQSGNRAAFQNPGGGVSACDVRGPEHVPRLPSLAGPVVLVERDADGDTAASDR